MPIEIRELHIKVAVSAGGAADAGGGAASQPPGAADGAGEQAQQALVAACVEQVLRILHNKMER
ncbi:DUF5908 family protein [Rugamonas sp. CCM 8940]|uniref:DUF5908 family protein n=1 Tax=Rugamonas sp. CCM 8940 TaxID=2765359 RepID=UPI0018F31074|nr:DUF5908 family protein [Rugamonas sp. CCM 8940]MBJ7312008.1 hypothetical protein [Rugamonas sp. CCM 8940]